MDKMTLLALLTLAIAGCSSPPKTGKGTSPASADPLTASAKKVEQDFSQTESDFTKLESQVQTKK